MALIQRNNRVMVGHKLLENHAVQSSAFSTTGVFVVKKKSILIFTRLQQLRKKLGPRRRREISQPMGKYHPLTQW